MSTYKLLNSLLNSEPTPFAGGNCTDGVPWIHMIFSECITNTKHWVGFIFELTSMLFFLIWLIPQVWYNKSNRCCIGISFFWILFNTIGDTLNLIGTVSRQHWAQWVYQSIVLIPEIILLFQFIYYRIVGALRNQHAPLLNANNDPPPAHLNVMLFGLMGFSYFFNSHGNRHEPKFYGNRKLLYELENNPTSEEITDYVIAGIMAFFYTASKLFQFPVNAKNKGNIQSDEGPVIFVFYLSFFGHLAKEIATILLYDQDIGNEFLIVWSFVWFFYNLVCVVLDGLLIAQCYYYKYQDGGHNQRGVRRVFRVFCQEID